MELPHSAIPRHVAIIMDGNGRWAQQRRRPRLIGHRAGARAVRSCVEFCLERGIGALTLFAFSSENWNRPAEEVGGLMKLFLGALEREEPWGVWGGEQLETGRVVAVRRPRGRPPVKARPVTPVEEVPVPRHLVA